MCPGTTKHETRRGDSRRRGLCVAEAESRQVAVFRAQATRRRLAEDVLIGSVLQVAFERVIEDGSNPPSSKSVGETAS